MAHGFICLTAVVDVASRRVLTHKVVTKLEACHAAEIIEEAFARFGLPEIFNTDQGSQFAASDFTDAVLSKGCKPSMDGQDAWRGDLGFCHNVFVERVWRSAKCELIYLKVYNGVGSARADIADYFNFDHTERPHSSPDHITLQQAYLNLLPRLAEAA